MGKRSKDEIIDKVLSSSIDLNLRKGHLKWSVTDLAKDSGISRTLIYYYFGKSKEAILSEAVQFYASEIFDTRWEVSQKLLKGEIENMIRTTRALISKNPHLVVLYSRFRNSNTSVGKAFAEGEKKYLSMITDTLPEKNKTHAKMIWAFIYGLTLSPSIFDSDLAQAGIFLRRFWQTG